MAYKYMCSCDACWACRLKRVRCLSAVIGKPVLAIARVEARPDQGAKPEAFTHVSHSSTSWSSSCIVSVDYEGSILHLDCAP